MGGWPLLHRRSIVSETAPYVVVGLGNPGREYRNNRHNFGFMLIDRICVLLNVGGLKLQARSIIVAAQYKGKRLILAKPQTYMNLSGSSVQGLLRFYKTPLENLLVAHDDLDLPFTTLRLRPGGGPGGQNGVASIIQQLGTQEFARLRMGIDRPPGRMDPADYVLRDFPPGDLIALSQVLDRAAEAALAFVDEGIDQAMNKFNGAVEV
jgi:PTH1 family peptidyl-tRNA hydrolase